MDKSRWVELDWENDDVDIQRILKYAVGHLPALIELEVTTSSDWFTQRQLCYMCAEAIKEVRSQPDAYTSA
jgi:hypothetical protein